MESGASVSVVGYRAWGVSGVDGKEVALYEAVAAAVWMTSVDWPAGWCLSIDQ